MAKELSREDFLPIHEKKDGHAYSFKEFCQHRNFEGPTNRVGIYSLFGNYIKRQTELKKFLKRIANEMKFDGEVILHLPKGRQGK